MNSSKWPPCCDCTGLLPLASTFPNYEEVLPEAPYRYIPPELANMFNVTKSEAGYCIRQFSQCFNLHTKKPFCAINLESDKKMFPSLCEMMLDNCVHNKEDWRYFSDDITCGGTQKN